MTAPPGKVDRLAWNREQHLRALGARVHDLAVVGGGATGCSVARDAALRGLDVCLLERSDLAFGASSRSTRFIHGGLRYLKTYEFGFVREGLQERAFLMAVAPHLVRSVPFLFPTYRDRGNSRWMVRLGVGLYDVLAGRSRLPGSRLLGPGETLALEPELKNDGLTGAVTYADALTDDARLVVETAVAAVEAGATVALHVEVERIVPSDSGPAVIMLRDRISGAPLGVRAGVVVNAAGVWLGKILHGSENSGSARPGGSPLRPSRGSHLAVARETLPVARVVVIPSRRDGRILFAVPAGEFTYVGTTEVVHEGALDEVRAGRSEVDYLREVAGEIFRLGPVPRERILCTWAGLRPLIERPGQPTGALSRDYRIVQEAPGVVAVAGGKLTSCRRMAEATVDLAASILFTRFGRRSDACITRWKLFPGAEAPAPEGEDEIPPGLDPAVARHLVSTYGYRAVKIFKSITRYPPAAVPLAPGCVACPAEVLHAVENEGAVRLPDLLFRRLHPHFIQARMGTPQGKTLVEGASKVMADRLGWTPQRRAAEVDHALEEWRRDFSVPG